MMRSLWGAALAVLVFGAVANAADKPTDFDNWLHARPLATTPGADDEMPLRQGGETRRLLPYSSFMRPDGANAALPTARNNLGLGTADTPVFSGLNLALTSETMPAAPILSITYGAVGAPLATGPEYGGYGFESIIHATPGVGINDPITGAMRGDSFLSAGTKGLAVGGFFRGYTSGTWGPDGSINAGSVGMWAEGRTSRGGNVFGVYGLAQSDTTAIATTAQAAEFDTGISTSVGAKFGVAVVSTDTDSGAVTGTSTVAGSGATVSNSAGLLIQTGGGAATGYKYGLLTVNFTGGVQPFPTDGDLWRAGGFTVGSGLNWPDMTFSGPVVHAKGLIQLDNITVGSASADGLIFKSLVGADTKTTSITLQEYSGLAVASIDFIGNSLSNFESRIALSTSSGSGKVERFSVAQDGGLYSKNATGGSKGADTLNLAGSLYFNGNQVVGGGAGYSNIYDGSGVNPAITFGPTGDPSNYYKRTNHVFQGNDGGGATQATINSTGISTLGRVIGSTIGVNTMATWVNNETCVAGSVMVDANFVYVCTTTNTVKRAALSAF